MVKSNINNSNSLNNTNTNTNDQSKEDLQFVDTVILPDDEETQLQNGGYTLDKIRNNNSKNNDDAHMQKKEEMKRDQWSNKFDFLVACLGFSIGLGNVWRFPYLCYKNGGGAFLLPYFLSVFFAGIPLFTLEVALGQFMNRATIECWNICPFFRGVGIGCTIINFLLSCYYTVILCWSFHFLFSSFTTELPWTKCGEWWNTENCKKSIIYKNETTNITVTDPTNEYWENRVLRISPGIDHIGIIQWDLALCLLFAWVLIFLCICKGIRTSGKIMYVTASAPYVFMIILLIRTSLLDGALVGLKYYLKPDWSKLTSMVVWSDAGTQIFFSYSIGLGVLSALGSYNKFHHNSFRDCVVFAATNTFTSLLAGCVIFATLGYMSVSTNIPIDEVAELGPGLAFIIYPKAIGTMPWSPLWSICFFTMLILLGMDSTFAGVEGFVAAITDYFPQKYNNDRVRYIFVGSVCLVSYLIGLSMVTNGGMYVFQLFDYYGGSRIILLIALMESIAIGYVYGFKRFNLDLKSMYGFSFGWVTGLYLCVIIPIFSLCLFIFSVIVYEKLTYKRAVMNESYTFPDWSVTVGWIVASSSVFCIPIVMIVELIRTPGSLSERFKYLTNPRYTIRTQNDLSKITVRNGHIIIDIEETKF